MIQKQPQLRILLCYGVLLAVGLWIIDGFANLYLNPHIIELYNGIDQSRKSGFPSVVICILAICLLMVICFFEKISLVMTVTSLNICIAIVLFLILGSVVYFIALWLPFIVEVKAISLNGHLN